MASFKAGARNKGRTRKTTARELALDTLTRIEQEQAYSNLLLNRSLQKAKLSSQEAGLATELVYGTIQRLNTIDYFLTPFIAKGLASLQPWVRALLRMSFYQLYYLERIPDHAAVSEAVQLAKRKGHAGISGLVNGVLRNVIRKRKELVIPEDVSVEERISLIHSHPLWLVKRWISQYGVEETTRLCAANNRPPKVSLRTNQRRISRESLIQQLRSEDIHVQPSDVSAVGLVTTGAGNMAYHPAFEEGLFSIQDESSMLVADVLDPQPGMTVLDCCAAPGGKTAHMAEKMDNQGTIWANDLHEHKRKLIQDQADRLGLSCIRTRTGDAAELTQHFAASSFDRILLDAPCSGLGVIRRKPDLKWTKEETDTEQLAAMQLHLLKQVSTLLKPGGFLVYSTCTLDTVENENVIRQFLQQEADFELDEKMSKMGLLHQSVTERAQVDNGMVQILPHYFDSDGFFICRLSRKA